MLSFASFLLIYFLIGTAVFLSYIYWTSLSTGCLIIALIKLNGLVVPDRVWISPFNSFIYYRLFRRFIFSNLFFISRKRRISIVCSPMKIIYIEEKKQARCSYGFQNSYLYDGKTFLCFSSFFIKEFVFLNNLLGYAPPD